MSGGTVDRKESASFLRLTCGAKGIHCLFPFGAAQAGSFPWPEIQAASSSPFLVEKSGVDLSGPVRLWFRSRTSVDKNFRDQICVAIDKNGVVTRVTRLGMPLAGIGLAHEVSILTSTAATLDYLWFVSN